MPISHLQNVEALRKRLRTLVVVASVDESMSVSGRVYIRAGGSFTEDGFEVGMEVRGLGFLVPTNNDVAIIRQVKETTLRVNRTLTNEALGAGKSLSVVIPEGQSYENRKFDPEGESPFLEEQYIPGAQTFITLGKNAVVEITPMYSIGVEVKEGTGAEAARRYADAILELFSPAEAMFLRNGDCLRVRGDTGPFPGQLIRSGPGKVVIPVTIPLRLRTQNVIDPGLSPEGGWSDGFDEGFG